MQQLKRTVLERGWRLQEGSATAEEYLPVEKLPTVVHLDLLANGKIPDPFKGMNELDVEWIGERTWVYSTTFVAPHLEEGQQADLVFDGLDTLCTVHLNDNVILQTENMFIGHRVNVSEMLCSGQENKLVLVFDSALHRGRELESQHVEHRFIAHNGEPGRLGVRKAQYHWGWDWGPVLQASGPWRPVALETYISRIDDLWVDFQLSEDCSAVRGTFHARTFGLQGDVVYTLALGASEVLKLHATRQADGVLSADFELKNPQLWYPVGYGKQIRYTLCAEILVNNSSLHAVSKQIGFRQVKVIRDADKFGESFYFRVNGIDVFCGGSCWIPADNFLPRISESDYREWLECMRDGNQVMIRVWGGGIYEEDVFYDICDELGLLVWQDFMFACGSYPVWPALLDSITQEAVYNCRRLRHHPSIIIWAGTNEDYQIQEEYSLDYQESDDPEVWLKSNFPARYIYEYLLPIVTAKEMPTAIYWPCSPFTGGGKKSSDLTIGDVHQWNVWHGTQEKYQRFPEIGGRFNSEFGMAAMPVMQTITSFIEDKSELYPQSRTMDFHNKADGHERRIATYVLENFKISSDFPTWLYLTQLMQCETMFYAYRDWRRQWGDSRRCGGALVWQLNDCWPCSSWAIVDYYRRPKPAYYAIKRLLKPIAVGVRREHHDWSVCHARPAKSLKFSVWIMSNTTGSVQGDLELRFVSVHTGKEVRQTVVKKGINLVTNGTTEVFEDIVDVLGQEPVVLAARLFINGECVSRDVDWPQPYKYLHLNNASVKLSLDREILTVSTERPIKGFVLDEQDGVSLSDNCIDLVPGDEQTITMRGFKGDATQIKWRSLT